MVSRAVDETGPAGRPHGHRGSLRGLDWLNFLMADVQGGLGPYLSVFLATRGWQAGSIGAALAAGSVAAALCQIPAGLLVDATRAKRMLTAASGLVIAGVPRPWPVLGAQVAIGAASALVPPTLAALALGLAGRARLDATISRNQGFNHAGTFAAAVLAGTLGQFAGLGWIFVLVCAFAAASAVAVLLIDPSEIDHALARGGEATGRPRPASIRSLLARRDLLVFLGAVALFHLGNAAMLPMAGQLLAHAHPHEATIALSACIVTAQAVMVGVAWAVGRAMARGVGRKPVLLLAFALLPVRGVLFACTSSPYAVVGIQLLDGVAAGIFGVVAVLVAADLMRGTGRFNLAQGLVALCAGVGAGLSSVAGEYAARWFGYPIGFLTLAAAAVAALLFFGLLMPETRPRTQPRAGPPDRTAAQGRTA